MNTLKLNKDADRRLKGGHLWIYSNEVNVKQTPLKNFTAGEQVLVQSSHGKTLGVAMINPNNLICGRLVNREAEALDAKLLSHRIQSALSLRERCFSKPYYRLVFGESDFLPGLVIDRFGDYFSVQTNTAGMDQLKPMIIDVLQKLFKPKGIIFKNDSGAREMEGLEKSVVVASGKIPDLVELEENNTRFLTSLATGQKTGWFYDHRNNRREMQALVKDKTVLDVFSYVGGWGLQALQAGAKSAICVDSSQAALDIAQQNAALNRQQEKFSSRCGVALDIMKSLISEKQVFDVVVIDPPAFIKKARDKKKGEDAYHHYNQLAMRLLKPEGLLISASCSTHLKRDELMNVIRVAGSQLTRDVQVFYQGGQGMDHPVHPSIPETEYLKAMFVRTS
jgi:23S rRNA (cytosine1962-C5)-methyltransferase